MLEDYDTTHNTHAMSNLDLISSVPIGSTWLHYNGNLYTTLFITNQYIQRPDKYPITVVYQGMNKRLWSRPILDWYRSMAKVTVNIPTKSFDVNGTDTDNNLVTQTSLPIGSTWLHNNGKLYTVITLTNQYTQRPDKYPVTVIYQGEETGFLSKPLSDWYRSRIKISS